MSRSGRRVHQLARFAACSAEEALRRLQSAGIRVRATNDLVPEQDYERAAECLQLRVFAGWLIPRETAKTQAQEGAAIASPSAATEAPQPEKRPRIPGRELVGHPLDGLSYLNAKEVEQIHWALVEDFARSRDPIFPPGVKSQDLLESAVHRVHTCFGAEAKYPTVPMAAAAYLHAVIHDHPFHNGNKRTALVATLVFLDLNGFVLEAEENDLFDYLIAIAAHQIITEDAPRQSDDEMLAISRWVHRHSRPISKEELPLKFHELRQILLRYGCSLEHPKRGNRMNIFRGQHRTQVYYRNDGTDVPRNAIRKIREDLHLLDEDGYDSTVFYNARERISAFVLKYRRTLDRLAKV